MTTAELQELLEVAERVPKSSIFDIGMNVDRRTFASLARLALAARDLRQCGIEHDDPRIGYVLAQLDRQDLAGFDAALAAVFGGDDE